MAKQIKWTKNLTESFIDLAMLSEEEAYIMRSRVKNTPISVQADFLGCSTSTVNRYISQLKRKYDEVQKEYPDKFPVRKSSAKETWMDNN